MYVGSKTGRDGIHGATMASESFSEEKEQRRPTVQVGDPFTEKLLLEACLELFQHDYIIGIQDMGAAGLTSSSTEMAGRGGCGIELDLSRVPMRETGMTPYEISYPNLKSACCWSPSRVAKRPSKKSSTNVISTPWWWAGHRRPAVPRFGEARYRLHADPRADQRSAGDHRPTARPAYQDQVQQLDLATIAEPKDFGAVLKQLLASPNLASKEWIYRQYDQYVRTNTIVAAGLTPGDPIRAGKGWPTSMVIADTLFDPLCRRRARRRRGARNLACVGARPVGLTDCLNFGSPENPEVMWQFAEAIHGMRDACLALRVPVVSGNVSFYNETDGVPIHPTPTIGMVGLLEKVEHFATPWFKAAGDVVVLLGRTREDLGGSEYLKTIHGLTRGTPPWIDLKLELAVQNCCIEAIEQGLLQSAHDVADGGLAVALAECCIGGPDKPLGVRVEAHEMIRADALLFSESQSRIIVSVKENNLERLGLAEQHHVPLLTIGALAAAYWRFSRCNCQ
jgi:phosphoribosylformylglycinamidine synthase